MNNSNTEMTSDKDNDHERLTDICEEIIGDTKMMIDDVEQTVKVAKPFIRIV